MKNGSGLLRLDFYILLVCRDSDQQHWSVYSSDGYLANKVPCSLIQRVLLSYITVLVLEVIALRGASRSIWKSIFDVVRFCFICSYLPTNYKPNYLKWWFRANDRRSSAALRRFSLVQLVPIFCVVSWRATELSRVAIERWWFGEWYWIAVSVNQFELLNLSSFFTKVALVSSIARVRFTVLPNRPEVPLYAQVNRDYSPIDDLEFLNLKNNWWVKKFLELRPSSPPFNHLATVQSHFILVKFRSDQGFFVRFARFFVAEKRLMAGNLQCA